MSQAPEIAKMLTLSTGHLRESTREWIDAAAGTFASYPKGDYGWFMYASEAPGEDYPNELIVCMNRARELGCEWIMFDVDGPELDGLVVFEERD